MSGVCGWFAAIEAPPRDPAGALAGMLAPMLENSIHPRRAIGQAWAIGGAAPSAANLDLAEGADTTVLTLGRIRFLTSDHEPLAVSGGTASAVSNTYARLRERVFEHVAGEFTIIIIDHARGEILAAVDRMGIHSLSWCESRNTLIFGASNDAINAFPELPRAINLQALYHYLYFHMIPAPGSVWLGRQRLLPGEFLRYAGGRTSTSQYWTPRFDESQRIPFAELKEEFVSTLRSAVASAAEGARVGCFLSGGTDSSTISGMLGLATGASASTYSIGFDEPGYDEMSYARIAARHFGTNHHEYYVTPDDVASLIPRIAESYDQPFGNSSAIPTYYCARMAHADGVERMLGGDGGDELFGGNKRYAKQHVFALYDHVPKALRRHLIAPLLGGLAGASGIPLLRKAKSYVAQASVPMPGRLETYNLLQRIGHERIFTEAFLQAVDRNGPIALLDTIYHGADAQSLINRMLALDFTEGPRILHDGRRRCRISYAGRQRGGFFPWPPAFPQAQGDTPAMVLQAGAGRFPSAGDHHKAETRIWTALRALADAKQITQDYRSR